MRLNGLFNAKDFICHVNKAIFKPLIRWHLLHSREDLVRIKRRGTSGRSVNRCLFTSDLAWRLWGCDQLRPPPFSRASTTGPSPGKTADLRKSHDTAFSEEVSVISTKPAECWGKNAGLTGRLQSLGVCESSNWLVKQTYSQYPKVKADLCGTPPTCPCDQEPRESIWKLEEKLGRWLH